MLLAVYGAAGDRPPQGNIMSTQTDVLIIGAGIVGTSIARELSRYELDVLLVEKEEDVGWGQTKASYAICHPGARWAQGTLAQRMMAASHPMWDQLVDDLGLELARIGELVLAFNEEELRYIYALKKQGEQNRMKGLEILGSTETRRLEPHVNPAVQAALHMPTAGVFNPFELVFAFSENARANGVKIVVGTQVTGIVPEKGIFIVQTHGDEIRARYVVNAAGLYAEKIAQMAGVNNFKISYETKSLCLILDSRMGNQIDHIFTGIADPKAFSRFKVVMPTYHRNLLIYSPFPEPAKGMEDRSVEKRAIERTIENTRSMVPDIDFERHIIASFSAVAARNNRGDFIIEGSDKYPAFVNVAVPPPGITSSPAIGKRVVELLGNAGLPLVEKSDFNPCRKAMERIRDSSPSEMEGRVRGDPRRGHVVCRCEKVSEAEIVEAVKRGATTVDGIKFRTRAGMGRCQSNYCCPEIAAILARELHLPVEKVTKKGQGSEYTVGKG
jgi:glycerol-3-phosphate dehydrogenase